MRRMYSEQELTKVIKEVFDAELESGALDSKVSDAVDAYLVEHPVDVTALEGQDVELNSLDATGLITGGEIVEKMSGYSFNPYSVTGYSIDPVYVGAVKNGNKLTLVCAIRITKNSGEALNTISVGAILIPASVLAKLYPFQDTTLDVRRIIAVDSSYTEKDVGAFTDKTATGVSIGLNVGELELNTEYYLRVEQTFLLSENLAPEE